MARSKKATQVQGPAALGGGDAPLGAPEQLTSNNIENLDTKSICFLLLPYITDYIGAREQVVASAEWTGDIVMKFNANSRWQAATLHITRPTGKIPASAPPGAANGIWAMLQVEYEVLGRQMKDNAVWDVTRTGSKFPNLPAHEFVAYEELDELFVRMAERDKYIAEYDREVARIKAEEAAAKKK